MVRVPGGQRQPGCSPRRRHRGGGAMAALMSGSAPFSRRACVEGRLWLLCPAQGRSLETHSSFYPQLFRVSFQILQPVVL